MTQNAADPRLTPLAMAACWNCRVQLSTLQPLLPSATPLHMAICFMKEIKRKK
jgi:hypothetical protein